MTNFKEKSERPERKLIEFLKNCDPSHINEEHSRAGQSYEVQFKSFSIRLTVSVKDEWYTPDSEPYSDVIMNSRCKKVKSHSLKILHKGRFIREYGGSDFAKRMYELAESRVAEKNSGLLKRFEKSLSEN